MNFPVQEKKATQAVARLIQQSGGPVDVLRVIKLIYLADRESLKRRGIPIVGGKYFSMRQGPVISEVMDFVKQRNAPDWENVISPRHGHEIRLNAARADFDTLSESEMSILDEVVEEHRQRTTEELVEWCHKNCSEYERVSERRKPIQVESILKAVGKSAKTIKNIVREAESLAELDELLA